VITAAPRIAGVGRDRKCRADFGIEDLEALNRTEVARREVFIVWQLFRL
jgi:hypothetical protein